MFDTIGGVPVHALIVHVPIVLIPLSAIGAILIAARPKALRLFGAATVIGAVVGLVASIIAKSSGQELAQRIGWPQGHTDYGNLFPWATATFLSLLLIFWLFVRGIPLNRNRPLWLKVFGAMVILASIGITYFTVLTGFSGASATWEKVIDKTQPGTFTSTESVIPQG